MTVRPIHTDTFTPKSKAILTALRIYMRDCWGSSQMERNANLATVEDAPNGEIIWSVDSDSYSYRRSTYSVRNDAKVREWLAASLKHAIYTEFRRKGMVETKSWKRTNKSRLDFLSKDGNEVTVAEAYCLFDRLLNRKTFAKRWKKPMLKEVVGVERDAVATELELARREEIAKIEAKYKSDNDALYHARYAAIEESRRQVNAEYDKKSADLKAAYLQSLKDLDDSLKFTTDLPDFLA